MGWDDARAKMARAVSGYFDTAQFTVLPMRKPGLAMNAQEEPDPTRPGFDFLGTLELAPEINAMSGARTAGAAERSARQVSRVCLTALDTCWPWRPRQGDRIRTTDALYQIVANPETDGSTGRVALWLNRISG